MNKLILLLFSCLPLLVFSQNNNCPTVLSEAQMKKLREIQQEIDKGTVSLGKKSMQYVPLQVHIVGNAKGTGYYQIRFLMRTLCELNARFIPTGFHFYLADSIDYIQDDDLYKGDDNAIWNTAENYKKPNTVNVFFNGISATWCGVYYPGVDVVFIRNSCQTESGATTLTHELGHFFGLPHTFSGWEGGNTPFPIETVNGSNCRSAGDGFCDTKADYVSIRWSCPLPWNLTDPNNIVFKPDSSIYMSYSMDACQSRFSSEQMLAMQSNLQSRGFASGQADLRTLPAPHKVLPLPGDSNINANYVRLRWNKVEGAFAYHLQIARFGDWNNLNEERLVYDTTAVADLFGDWQYAWRVKAFTAANTCSEFGEADTFYTHEVPMGQRELFVEQDAFLYPNPVRLGEKIFLRTTEETDLVVYNHLGQKLETLHSEKNQETELKLPYTGMYFISFYQANGSFVKRLLVE